MFWLAAALSILPGIALASAAEQANSRYAVDLRWEDLKEAKQYVLQISTDEEFRHVISETHLDRNSTTWHTDTAGYYYWRVAGVDRDGDQGPFSEFNTFAIQADRNRKGDEHSYESFIRFDDYSQYRYELRVAYGVAFSQFYFSGNTYPPAGVVYQVVSPVDGQASCDLRLNPYYSLKFSVDEHRLEITSSSFSGRPYQLNTLDLNQLQIHTGLEKRIFFPHNYIGLHAGIQATFMDLPEDDGNGNVLPNGDDQLVSTPAPVPFIGVYGSVSFHQFLGRGFEAAVLLGGFAEDGEAAYTFGQYASLEIRHELPGPFHVGLKGDEVLTAYKFGNTTDSLLSGTGHALTFVPSVFLDWSF